MKFTGKVKNGSLIFHDEAGLKRHLNGIKGDVWVDIKEAPKTRSTQQNNYYRHIIRQIGNHLGYDEDEMHDVIKQRFGIRSTKDLDTEEFTIKAVAENICKIFDFDKEKIIWDTSKPKGQHSKPSSGVKLELLGYDRNLFTPTKEALEKTCSWFVEN